MHHGGPGQSLEIEQMERCPDLDSRCFLGWGNSLEDTADTNPGVYGQNPADIIKMSPVFVGTFGLLFWEKLDRSLNLLESILFL